MRGALSWRAQRSRLPDGERLRRRPPLWTQGGWTQQKIDQVEVGHFQDNYRVMINGELLRFHSLDRTQAVQGAATDSPDINYNVVIDEFRAAIKKSQKGKCEYQRGGIAEI